MHAAQEGRPRARSPFVAAFLSLIFPGLGHAYAGVYTRALTFAALPILAIALGAGFYVRASSTDLIELVLAPWLLPGVFVVNILVLLYRAVAIVDAYRVTEYVNAASASGDGRLGRARIVRNPVSLAGLLAVVAVMAVAHVAVARYDLMAVGALNDPCVFITENATGQDCDSPGGSPGPSAGPTEPAESPEGTPEPSITEPPVQGSALPNAAIPPWDGKERLNILLIGSDQRPKEGTYNTDTLIVVSVDPVSRQVAMFSLPRDTVDVPMPRGPLRNAYGSVYTRKINSFFTSVRNRADLVPGTDRTRGYNGLKLVLGELYGVDIKYFVEVNFEGFKQVVDAMGGVTINVQVPVTDDSYPSDTGRMARVYIPAGLQHMTGAQALVYARSRHGSTDFDRGQRQQRVLISLREQADVATLIPRIDELLMAVRQTVRTDIPPSELAKLAGLASSVDTRNIRSFVFTPSTYQTEFLHSPRGYIIVPKVDAIRKAVANAFKADPVLEEQRVALAQEGARLWVINQSGKDGQASRIADYLAYQGLAASAPNQRPEGTLPNTKITVYNGADSRLSKTIDYLQKLFGVKIVTASDPAVGVDVIVTTGTKTPNFVPPNIG
jgi:LCP family protein required for cell wall assembly